MLLILGLHQFKINNFVFAESKQKPPPAHTAPRVERREKRRDRPVYSPSDKVSIHPSRLFCNHFIGRVI